MNRLIRMLCLIVAGALLSACAGDSYGLPKFKLRYETAIERRASLAVLRRVWQERPPVVNSDAALYERTIINRAALFGRKVKGTESYRGACDFWMVCVREHIARYEEDAARFGK